MRDREPDQGAASQGRKIHPEWIGACLNARKTVTARSLKQGNGMIGDCTREFVLSTLASIESQGVICCLKRGLSQLDARDRVREIDLIVRPEDLPALTRGLAKSGFTPVPSWGHAPHHSFVAYFQPGDAWVKFDVVTDLRYGHPIRALRAGIFPGCLARRRASGPAYVLSAEDEFVTLLLHCLIHAKEFDQQSRTRLAELQMEFAGSSAAATRVAELIDEHFAPALGWSVIAQAIDHGDWDLLLGRRGRVMRQLFWREPVRSLARLVGGLLMRRLRPLLFAWRRRGLSVALLAPDGVGKTTLARQLAGEEILRARMIYMGLNIDARTAGLPTTRWLAQKVQSLNGNRRSLRGVAFRGLNLANSLAERWYLAATAQVHRLRGGFVIFDRYAYDSLLRAPDRRLWKRFRHLLFDVANAKPDLIILLDAPPEIAQQRKREHDLEWHIKQREGYLRLRELLPGMVVVDAGREQAEVRREVTARIWNRYRTRAQGNYEAGSRRT